MMLGLMPTESLGGALKAQAEETEDKSIDFTSITYDADLAVEKTERTADVIGGYDAVNEKMVKIDAEDLETYGFVFHSGIGKAGFDGNRFNTQGGMSYHKACIEFKANAGATVTVKWTPSGGGNRYAKLCKVSSTALGDEVSALSIVAADKTAMKTSDTFSTEEKYTSTFSITEAGKYSLGSSSSGMYIYSIDITYPVADSLKAMSIGMDAETSDFGSTKQVFGQTTVSDTEVYSENSYIKLSKGENTTLQTQTNDKHGLMFSKDIVFEVIVPANTMGEFKFIACQYANCSATVTAGSTTVAAASSLVGTSDGDEIPFTYSNTSSGDVRMKLTVSTGSTGYIHGVSYEVKDIPAKQWQAGKTGTVIVGDTTFTITSGNTESDAFTVVAAQGSGSVEISGKEKAVVWANLSGSALSASVTKGDGTGDTSVSGSTVTMTYSDDTTLPSGYEITVRDLSKAAEPEQDGKTVSYNLTDGSVLSQLHTVKLLSGTEVASEDGHVILCSAGSMKFNDTTHGISFGANDSIKVKVAGNAKVSITTSSFGTSGITASALTGTVYVSGDATKTVTTQDTTKGNPQENIFLYEGDATTLTFTFTGGTSYSRLISVTNEALEGNKNTNAVKVVPSLINWNNGKLTATETGQKITLSNATQIVKTNIKTSGLGIYAFPLTTDNNTLSVDLVVGKCDSSTNYAVMVGLFNVSDTGDNGIRAITTGIRSSNNEVVQLMSKSDSEVLGKNSFSGTMSAGDVVNVTISRDGKNVIQTFTNKTTGAAITTKTTAYGDCKSFTDPGGEVYYGIMVAHKDATITNMVYTDANGNVLYDQNAYYDPVGTAPVISSVTAAASEDRTQITVSWEGGKAEYDAKYVLQVKKPGSTEWEDIDTELTSDTYDYKVLSGSSGNYTFRVCGTLGNSKEQNEKNRTAWVESNVAGIDAALTTPELELSYTSSQNKTVLSWNASAEATSYEIYRRYDDKEAELIATVSGTTYTDESVAAETVYYYSVAAKSNNNFSPKSEEKWTLVTDGHTGDYDENIALYVTDRSYNTVFENKITLKGVAGASGTIKVYVNDVEKASQNIASANGTFSFENIEIDGGRNEVELVLEYGSNLKVRKSLNFVYLTNYDYVVDASFTGTDGDKDANGIPQYKTVAAAIAAVPSGNSSSKVILVRNGDYNEKLNISTPYISLIGEDSVNTRIYYAVSEENKNKEADNSRYAVTINKAATGFSAENICIENAWEYTGTYSNESAEAIYCEASNAVFVGVRLMSYQDTIQSKDNTMYLLRCYVSGNVDYMWGQRTKVLFDDCDFEFRYNANKNSGYYTAYGPGSQAIYNNCRFYAESNCGGTKYYLGRPYQLATAVTFIDCYMGSILNRDWGYATWGGKELYTDAEQYNATEYYECGTYGAGYAVNINRRQISRGTADQMLTTSSLGWDPYNKTDELGGNYIGTIVTEVNNGTTSTEFSSTKYSQYEGDDTGLAMYDVEGFADSSATTGGGLLKETNENYYKVATGDEFLEALVQIRAKSGVPSVIEITSDSISLGYNEVSVAKNDTNIIAPHNPALLNPVLQKSGVSKVYLKQISNLTIFSQNGATIKHGAFDINQSSNIIIRNISFDELWEWDEETLGDYDVNDWDYMTIENGSSRVWIDHCTFYKSYDGVIDIKTTDTYATPMYITVSWCEFLPGSQNNTFFNEMMDYLDEHKDSMPYYKSLLESGMSKEQIWWYAYGQKKTHLLGQNDEASANKNLNVTFANNYYYNSMDRMPRLRFGTAHVYNCIMDSQELLDAKDGITNEDAAKHIVSNGASSTCDAQILLENCYINGIQNALNSGNGSSPSGYINAINSSYYMYGKSEVLEPKCNTTKEGEQIKVTDADEFISALPYSEYHLYDSETLDQIVIPYSGAGKLNLTVLQWEKTEYNATYIAPSVVSKPSVVPDPSDSLMGTVHKAQESKENEIPESIMSDEIKNATGCETAEELVVYLKNALENNDGAQNILSGVEASDTYVTDVTVMISNDGGKTWMPATEENFPTTGVDIVLNYPNSTDSQNYDFVIGHLITMNCNGQKAGTMEYLKPEKTKDGLKIHINSASPFVIGWKEITSEVITSDDNDDSDEGEIVEFTALSSNAALKKTAKSHAYSDYTPVIAGSLMADASASSDSEANVVSDAAVTADADVTVDAAVTADTTVAEVMPATSNMYAVIAALLAALIAVMVLLVTMTYRRKKQ
jgi:pectate lyase/pectin methylesterase-like acyl-CoA thioesterase